MAASMAACIAFGCSCPSFAGAPNCKGSLIGYSRGCQTCGHLMKEHRQMSTLELHVQKEVAAASSARCCYTIPFAEIHHSAAIGPYDPIEVPYDESLNGEAGVECCCKGFQIASLCTIFDRIPRGSRTDALEMLPTVCCSGCGHLLMHHQSKPMQAVGSRLSLSIKSYSQLPFSLLQTVNDGYVLLYEPCKDISLFAITVTEQGLAVVACRKQFPQVGEHRSEERPSDRLLGRSVDAKVDVCLKSKKLKCDKTSEDNVQIRRSARLAEKRTKKETSENKDTIGIGSESCENEGCGSIEASCQPESIETVTSFIESLRTIDNYYRWTLPETISTCFAKEPTSIQGVTAIQAKDPTNGDEGLLLAIATTNGGLYVCLLSMVERSVKYFTELLPVTENVQCLCFQKTTHVSDIHLCTGGQAGTVCVWRIWFQKKDTESIVCKLKYTWATDVKYAQGSITACSFSHDGSKLVAGTEQGDIHLYLLDTRTAEKSLLKHSHVLHCSRSQVTCLSWSSDGRLLGVGGADDCVQVVLVDEAKSRQPQSSCSLLNYFSPVQSAKLCHTHILKGHVSFVSGISFFSHHLVSVGLDGQILFWDVLQPDISDKIEQVEPKCGFKLGPSSQCEVLPASITGIGPSEILLILRGQKSKVTLAHYSSTCNL